MEVPKSSQTRIVGMITNLIQGASLLHIFQATMLCRDAPCICYHPYYRIVGKFSGELNLAVWRYAFKPPN